MEEKNKNYWLSKKTNQQSKNIFSSRLPKLYIPGQTFDRIFGGNSVDIRPQGSAELIFGLKTNRLDNPSLPEEQRKTTSFDFQEKIQMNVIGKIGEKLKLTTNFNTESTFDFENQMRLEYTGSEDEIIKNGNFPLVVDCINGHSAKKITSIPLGDYAKKKFNAGEYNVPCALIIGKRKESTDKKTSLNNALREYNVSV